MHLKGSDSSVSEDRCDAVARKFVRYAADDTSNANASAFKSTQAASVTAYTRVRKDGPRDRLIPTL